MKSVSKQSQFLSLFKIWLLKVKRWPDTRLETSLVSDRKTWNGLLMWRKTRGRNLRVNFLFENRYTSQLSAAIHSLCQRKDRENERSNWNPRKKETHSRGNWNKVSQEKKKSLSLSLSLISLTRKWVRFITQSWHRETSHFGPHIILSLWPVIRIRSAETDRRWERKRLRAQTDKTKL